MNNVTFTPIPNATIPDPSSLQNSGGISSVEAAVT